MYVTGIDFTEAGAAYKTEHHTWVVEAGQLRDLEGNGEITSFLELEEIVKLDFERVSIDWSSMKRGKRIYVKDFIGVYWETAYFSHYSDGRPYAYKESFYDSSGIKPEARTYNYMIVGD
jgi:hypothetical protein